MIKHNKIYTDEFKRSIVNEVMYGPMCMEEAKRHYGIGGSSTISRWIRKFDGLQTHVMKKKTEPTVSEITQLEAENKRLRAELDLERLKVLSLNVMIDLAEEQLKVPIRKKSGAKQLKK